MDGYFNEEDLINDYINDADEEEPPFDCEEYATAITEPGEPPTLQMSQRCTV